MNLDLTESDRAPGALEGSTPPTDKTVVMRDKEHSTPEEPKKAEKLKNMPNPISESMIGILEYVGIKLSSTIKDEIIENTDQFIKVLPVHHRVLPAIAILIAALFTLKAKYAIAVPSFYDKTILQDVFDTRFKKIKYL